MTARAPWGPGESFLLPEILELARQGNELTVLPLRPGRRLAAGAEAALVATLGVSLPLLGRAVIVRALLQMARRPRAAMRLLWTLATTSGGVVKAMKNLAVLPKGLSLAWECQRRRVEHIHAHWASTPSTAAYVAAAWTGLPWSVTAHRWDIAENNMLREKARTAAFVRAISQRGAHELRAVLPRHHWGKVRVIHVGVRIQPPVTSAPFGVATAPGGGGVPAIASVGNLIPLKGHAYLIEACAKLKGRNIAVHCHIFGDGPLRLALERLAKELGVDCLIDFHGQVPHDQLLAHFAMGAFSFVVHPSIETPKGEKEGIPVALMEAMASGIPVISTPTGSIAELLGDGAGIMVPPQDADALASAIEGLLQSSRRRAKLAGRARELIEGSFLLSSVSRQLSDAMAGETCGRG